VAAGPGGGPPWGWIAAGVAAAIVLAVALALALGGDDDDVATGDSTTTTEEATTTSSSSTTTSSSTTSSTSSTTSTTAPGAVALSTTDLDLGTTAGSAQFQVRNSGGAPVSYALTTSRFLGLNRRTGTLQPGASHTVVVSLDRAGAPEGDFSGSVRLDAGDSGTGAVGVTAVIAARPPALGEVSTTEPNVYTSSATSCPDTDVVVTFSDESPVTGVLTFRSTSFPDGEVAMAVADGRATATFERPPTLELITYTVTLTDSLGATVTTEQRTIEARPSC
jgi:hypothetical protein